VGGHPHAGAVPHPPPQGHRVRPLIFVFPPGIDCVIYVGSLQHFDQIKNMMESWLYAVINKQGSIFFLQYKFTGQFVSVFSKCKWCICSTVLEHV
jgi:hypothetical protein